MDELVVTTVVYCPPEEAYEFLADFPRYTNYTKYLKEARQNGDGGEGTRYALQFAWWKLTYTARSEVTELVPPERIEWRIVNGLDAHGRWRVEEVNDLPVDAPADAKAASRVFFEVKFDPDSAHSGMLDLPRLVSLDWVVRKVKPLVEEEARRVVARAVEDLEGRRREVDLEIRQRPG